jgi:hypothetical protein
MIQIRFDFGEYSLEGRGGQIRIHIFEFLAAIKHPIQAFDTSGVMLLLSGVDP